MDTSAEAPASATPPAGSVRTSARRRSVLFGATLLAGYTVICLAIFLLQDRLTYIPTRSLGVTPDAAGLAFEEVWLTTPDERCHAWFLPHPTARAYALFLHGNAGNISGRIETLRNLHALGLATLIVDYPGYGLSTGEVSEAGCYRAARAAFDELRRRAAGAPLIVWGRSLGGGVASELMPAHDVRLMILESTFTSVPDLAQDIYPWLPARLLARNKFDTKRGIAAASYPVLVIHSPQDDVIPFAHGQELFAAAPAPKAFAEIAGDHNTGFMTSADRYESALDSFLDEHLD